MLRVAGQALPLSRRLLAPQAPLVAVVCHSSAGASAGAAPGSEQARQLRRGTGRVWSQPCSSSSWRQGSARPLLGPLSKSERRFAAHGAAGDPEGFYRTLGVPHDAPEKDIKAAYRKLALQWHPDRNPDNPKKAEAEFKRISKAYSVLSDPQQRGLYDLGGGVGQGGAFSMRGQQGRPLTEEEARVIFKQMFGNKSLNEIIREVEQAAAEQTKQMEERQEELRARAERIREEVAILETRAMTSRNPAESFRLKLAAQQKMLELDQVQQMHQKTWVERINQSTQLNHALFKLRQLDPVRQAENRVRRGLAWGAALGAYFIAGASLVQAIVVFIATSFAARLGFALWAKLRK